jgi:probable F420-dependent oxidoreductase
MKFSVLLPHLNYSASPAAIRDAAQAAEELGFYSAGVTDTIQYTGWWVSAGSMEPVEGGDRRNHFETFTTLAYLAGQTETIRLMTSVIVPPYREPLLAAKQLAAIDHLSDGRLNVGVGVGRPASGNVGKGLADRGSTHQYTTLGLPANRGPVADEYIEAWLAIWTQEKAEYHGEYVDFEDVSIFPKPVQSPHPPIWVGGRSRKARERVAKYGEVWNPSQPDRGEFAEGRADVLELFKAAGRPEPTDFSINIFCRLGNTDEDAVEYANDTIESRFASPEDYRERTILGDTEGWLTRLQGWADVGVTNVELKPIYNGVDELLNQMEWIAQDIIPEMADEG